MDMSLETEIDTLALHARDISFRSDLTPVNTDDSLSKVFRP